MDLDTTIEALAPRLLRYCLGLSGNHALAEDASQEAMAALIGRFERHGPPDDAAAFVFTVARRRLKRRLWRRRLRQPLETLAGFIDDTPSPEIRSIGGARLDATLAALDHLSGSERDALMLMVAGELTAADAAKQLGISTSAFKMRVHRARQHLRQLLEDEHEFSS